MTNSSSGRRKWLTSAALLASLAALVWTFRDVQLDRVGHLLGRLGPLGVLLALTPQLAGLTLETLGWRATFALLGERVAFRPLLWIRFATEALVLSLPGGAVIAEPLKVPLLRRHANLDTPSAVAGVIARKYLQLGAQGVWLVFAALLGALALVAARPGAPALGLIALVGAAGVGVGGAALLLRVLLSRGGVATRIRRWLARLPSETLRGKLVQSQATFANTDGRLAGFFGVGRLREGAVGLAFTGAWAAETIETFVLLRLLGVDLDFGSVAVIEVSMTLLRNVAFVVPAGIGIQDLGYALLLRWLGVPEATELSAAFTLLKRGKELLLVTLGLGLLGTDQASARALSSSRKAAAAAL